MIKGLLKKIYIILAAYKTSMIIMVLFCGIAIIGSRAVTFRSNYNMYYGQDDSSFYI